MKYNREDFILIKEAVDYYAQEKTKLLMDLLTAEVTRSQEQVDYLYNNKILPELIKWWKLQDKLRK